MKLKFLCFDCIRDKVPDEKGYVYLPFDANSIIDLTDNYCYDFVCANGHENHFFLAVPKYAILFDMGISAYLDGYYREAVLDFAACYERFHEYCIYMLLWQENSFSDDELSNLWKTISSQSERQLGAFTALFFNKIRKLPVRLTDNTIHFRNDVTHKGKFPTKQETYDFALAVANYVKANINEISTRHGFDIKGVYPAVRESVQKKRKYQAHAFMTVITQYSCGNDFDESIELFKRQFNSHYQK